MYKFGDRDRSVKTLAARPTPQSERIVDEFGEGPQNIKTKSDFKRFTAPQQLKSLTGHVDQVDQARNRPAPPGATKEAPAASSAHLLKGRSAKRGRWAGPWKNRERPPLAVESAE